MRYYSLKNRNAFVDFKQATLEGQAPDGGLYFPETIPEWSPEMIRGLRHESKTSIGINIMQPYIGNAISPKQLFSIIEETLSFDFPLRRINERISSLELFHGPTLAFKDVGARFLSRCMGNFARNLNKKIVVLVATSGDTGGAVADAFHNVPGTEVIILYPSGKVSPVQEKQLTALGGNIHALEIEGDFDDCQRLVKMAFQDEEIKKNILLTSSNSINISRWLPQQIYYALGMAQWDQDCAPVISVPSGNFGNLCAGLLAQKSGLPVGHFIAACNANDVFTAYINTGEYNTAASIPTVSNAMDVGNPSNFIRILELFNNDRHQIKKSVSSISVTDAETKTTIQKTFATSGYILDPHAAVALNALQHHLDKNETQKGFILGTADPVKFPSVIEQAISISPTVPERIKKLMEKEKKTYLTTNNYSSFRSRILGILKNI